jgi:serine/threonine protein kinase, bacterial
VKDFLAFKTKFFINSHKIGGDFLMSTLSIGTILRNRYRISSVLQSGPLTSVYKAEDTHMIGNIWAVKEMKILAMDDYERQKIITQFQREFVKMTELSHPNLARVIDYFAEGQKLYIIREFTNAFDVATVIARGAGFIREEQACRWAVQIADVLRYLYNKKFPPVFFREFNLENVLVTSNDEIKIIDLGLAWIYQTEADPKKISNLGSMEYASPEQFDENGIFDQRSLVYSLGVLLHHILTGVEPTQHLFNLPPVTELNAEVSKRMCGIIEKATRKKPQDRFPGLSDMRKALMNTGTESKGSLPLQKLFKIDTEDKLNETNRIMLIIIALLLGGIVFLLFNLLF